MKALICEKCGGINLKRNGETFICEHCGTSYAINDTERLRVSIDNSEEVQKLFKAARRAKELENYDGAQSYYDQILGKNPDSWEAVFNTVYLRFMQCKIGEIAANALTMQKVLPTIIDVVHDEYSEEQQDAAVKEILSDLVQLSTIFMGGAGYMKSVRNDITATSLLTGNLLSAATSKATADAEFKTALLANTRMYLVFGDAIESTFGDVLDNRTTMKKTMVEAWKPAIPILSSNGAMAEAVTYSDKISFHDPDYKIIGSVASEKANQKRVAESKRKAAERSEKTSEFLSKNKKNLIIAGVVAALLFVAVITSCIASVNNANEQARANAQSAVAGKTFEGTYTYSSSLSSYYNKNLLLTISGDGEAWSLIGDSTEKTYKRTFTHETSAYGKCVYAGGSDGVTLDIIPEGSYSERSVEPFTIKLDSSGNATELVTKNWNGGIGLTLRVKSK